MGDPSMLDGADFDELRSWLKKQIAKDGVTAEDVSDIFQDALVALRVEHHDWAVDDPRTEERLRRIAHNLARNVRRRKERHRTVSLDEQPFLVDADADPFPSNGDRDLASLPSPLAAKVWDVVKSELGEIDREIFTLRVADLDYAEIGKRLGLTPDHVREHYNRAARKVRIRLGFPANPDCVDWWGG